MSSQLYLDHYLNSGYVPVTNQPRLVYVLLEIRPGETLPTIPVPVNLGIVVDKSESMCIPILTDEQFEELARMGSVREVMADGIPVWQFENVPPGFTEGCPRNIDFVKSALRSALEQLSPNDRFALVAFAGKAITLIPNQSGANKHRLLKAIDQLDDVQLGDDTYMAKGMGLGYEEVQRGSSPSMVNRMIVLTDGFTMDASQCEDLARQAAEAGIRVSTMGLGVEFNEELLISIADNSGGHAYLIHEAQDIPQAFAQELAGMQSIALCNLELKMRLASGVELRRAHKVKPVIYDLGQVPVYDRSVNIPLGDLEKDAPPAVLLELIVPPRPAGSYRLAHIVLAYDNPAQNLMGEKVRQDIVVQYTDDPRLCQQQEPKVMNLVETVSAFKLQTRALQEAEMGDVGSATKKLRAAATRLLNMGEDDLANAALQEADRLEKEGKMSPAATKKLRYETRKLTQKLED